MKSNGKLVTILVLTIILRTSSQQMDSSLTINYNYINSLPQNARVYLNDAYIGNTPLHFKWSNDTITGKIKLKLDGYAVYEYSIKSSENLLNKTFKLIPLPGIKKKEIVMKEKSYSFQKPLKIVPIIISSAVTVTSVILAYYFKSKAIEKNDEFNQTGDPSLIDKKKKYDLIGGISLAVFQIGLCALIYYHFIDN